MEMHKYVICNPDKCLGCKTCEFACSAIKENSLDPSLSRIRVVNFEPTGSMAIACLLCEDPPCVAVCPTKALFKGKNGVIQVDEGKCTGCKWCLKACRFGAITWNPVKRTVMMCDLCDGDPECVKLCPFEGALTFSTLEEVGHSIRREAVAKILQELIKRSGGE